MKLINQVLDFILNENTIVSNTLSWFETYQVNQELYYNKENISWTRRQTLERLANQ